MLTPEVREKIEKRAERLALWWPLLNEPYDNLISRSEQSDNDGSGFDDDPRTKPCEHRLAWRVGNLCLCCDNTGWRRLTRAERGDKMGIDPYSANLSAGITIVKDESPASRRARDSERVNQIIAGLERDERVRAGLEAEEDRMMRSYRKVERKPHTVKRILHGIELLRIVSPRLYEELPSHRGFVALATLMYRLVPGNILPPMAHD